MNNYNYLENNININEDIKNDIELFELMNFIKNFVYSNWNNLDYKYKTTDIIIDPDEEEEYLNDEEIFYKDILYI